MLITAFSHFWPEGHREPRKEVGFLSPAQDLVGFESEILRSWLQRVNPLGYFLVYEFVNQLILSTDAFQNQYDG